MAGNVFVPRNGFGHLKRMLFRGMGFLAEVSGWVVLQSKHTAGDWDAIAFTTPTATGFVRDQLAGSDVSSVFDRRTLLRA
jgi:hypothetical protein